ncbi:hypothetical protein J2S98_002763 [Arthrobacter oryzae]|nr:hypothetical protein [Arthrobacter oryzae]
MAESLVFRHLPNLRSPWTGGGLSPLSLTWQGEELPYAKDYEYR